jgi:hypothetical protein
MRSWVRYSVSAYMGLLLAGSIATPGTAPPPAEPMASIYQRSAPPPQPSERYYLVPAVPRESDRVRADS